MHHDLIFVGSEGIEFGIDTSYFERELSSRNTPETIINHCLCFKQEVLLFKVHVIFSVAVLDTVGTEALCPLRCSEAYGHKFGGEICPTETESAQLLLSYKIDLMSVHKGLENITCIIWHILNLYTCSYGYMNGLISYLPESEVAVARLDVFSPTTGEADHHTHPTPLLGPHAYVIVKD